MRSLACLAASICLLGGCSDPAAGEDRDAASEETRPEGVALCYTELSSSHPAVAEHWAALSGGHLDDRAKVIASLEEAAAAHPDEEEFALLLGLASLWRIAEPLPSEEGDLAGLLQAATVAQGELERAYELCPTDHRIPAWLGPLLVNMGRAQGDQAQIQEGLEVLERGIGHYPAFVLFSKLLIYADLPASDPDFVMALEALEANLDYCAGDGPLGLSGDPACTNHSRAHHNIEGASIFLGDVFAKAGRRDSALRIYEVAMSAPGYAGWQWRDLLAERISIIDDRISRYGNGDPTDDPDSIWNTTFQCSLCHRE